MSIYVGVEGGGTKTRILIQRGDAAPSYHEFEVSLKVRDNDWSASSDALGTVLTELLGKDISQVTAVAVGLSGMSRTEDQDAWKSSARANPAFTNVNLHIETDATLTLSAVLGESEEGIVLIAGTGSVLFFQPHGGAPRRIGGWGSLLSDEGSGYRIGLRVLSYYIRVLDGVYPPDELSQGILLRLPEEIRENRMEIVKLAERDSAFVSSLAPIAFELSQQLAPAHDLVYEELIELAMLVFPVFAANVMSGKKPYKLFLSGSIAKHPIMIDVLQNGFEETDITLIPVEDHLPCLKALEIARWL